MGERSRMSFLDLVKNYLGWRESRLKSTPRFRVELGESTIRLVGPDRTESISIDAIERIVARLADDFTTDTVWIQITTNRRESI